jgi:hypothetical protein
MHAGPLREEAPPAPERTAPATPAPPRTPGPDARTTHRNDHTQTPVRTAARKRFDVKVAVKISCRRVKVGQGVALPDGQGWASSCPALPDGQG